MIKVAACFGVVFFFFWFVCLVSVRPPWSRSAHRGTGRRPGCACRRTIGRQLEWVKEGEKDTQLSVTVGVADPVAGLVWDMLISLL